jgi:hypothetical protein
MVRPAAAARSRKRPAPQNRAADAREAVALFLGAGASKAFGYPLTGELLPDLRRFLHDGTLRRWGVTPSDQDMLRRGLREILPGIPGMPRRRLPLITDVLTLVDHSMHTGTTILSGWSNAEVTHFRSVIEQVLAYMVGPDGGPETSTLHRVADWVTRTAQRRRLGIITTNYDIELELCLFAKYGKRNVASRFDFGMSWRDPAVDRIYQRPDRPALRYFKLHGSLNWLRCPMCEYVYVNVDEVSLWWATEEPTSEFNRCYCGHRPLQSVLVAPSFVRDTRDVNLVGIWRNSLDLLASADRWIIVGYSLPAEDIAIRSLLLKAYRIRGKLRERLPLRIDVVQKGIATRPSYRLLFPEATFHAGGIERFRFDGTGTS